MIIREIEAQDALVFNALLVTLAQETDQMLLTPEESKASESNQVDAINQLGKVGKKIYVAEVNDKIVGFIGATRGRFARNCHTCYFAVGVLSSNWHTGVGSALIQRLEEWAASSGITRIELSVITSNSSAIALYEKSGYTVEGTKKNSLKLSHGYADEYSFAKLLK